ncbi:ferritin-like domain-containing protein [Chloroflexota bacterium]
MDKEKIIEMLNSSLEDEHAAIIQYLGHAYAIGEGEVSCEIEAIARDEMRHFDWLAEAIAGLSGIPSIEKGATITGGQAVVDWMNNNVKLETGAITKYEKQIAEIDDPKIKRLLKRIVSDEKAHHNDFTHFMEKAPQTGLKDVRGDRKDKTTEMLDWGIEHEYTVILQYLIQSYASGKEKMAEELQDQAINEMQHLGWLAEAMVDGGGNPHLKHTMPDQSNKPSDMLKADIKIEIEVAEAYDRASKETDDPGLKKLLERIRDNEIYHAEVFSDILEEEGD